MSEQTKNVEEKELTIKWLMQEDKIVKFEEVDETYDISDPVAKFDFEKAGVKAHSKVTVKIDRDQGDHGMVVFMTKSKNTGSSSTQSSGSGVIKTVKAYGLKYNGSLLFTDNEKQWYSCNKSIDKDSLSQYKDKTVEVQIKEGPEGGKYVNSIKLVDGGQPQSSSNTTSSKNSFSNSSDPKQSSIEAQACVNSANTTVSRLFAGKFDANKAEDGVLVKTLIDSIAKKNWELVQELKKKA